MEPNMALVLQRFEQQLDGMAADLSAIRQRLDMLVIDEGDTDADGGPIAHIRVHQIQPRGR